MTSVFDILLSPGFMRETYRKKPLAKPSAALDLRKTLNWDRVIAILSKPHANCWLAHNGVLAEHATGLLTPETAMNGFTSGRTVLIRHSEQADPLIQRLAERFATEFSADVDIQLFGTPTGQTGFGWHYDLEEVFIIQSSGTKTYYLRANRDPGPYLDVYSPKSMDDLATRTQGDELIVTLAPGDFLYLPAGYWHTARAETDSWHYSIGLTVN